MFRKFRAGLVAGSAMLAVAAFNVPAASAANSGTVECVAQNKVVGVWVDVQNGKDGWASRSAIGGAASRNRWSFNTQGKNYKLHVGCGGSTSKWKYNIKTPTYAKWTNVWCQDFSYTTQRICRKA